MEIRNNNSLGQTKTEYQSSAERQPSAKAPVAEAIGSQLNRMAGVKPDTKLYENKNGLNKESFLKMMTEQLKFQDPFNPVKNENFTQQMAMLSQLEQQINMNENLEKMASAQNNHQIAALQLVGKNISADKAAIYHDADKASTVQFTLPQDATDVRVQVLDQAGEPVREIGMGAQNSGELHTKWDGLSEQGFPMPSGRYSYKILAKDMAGKDLGISTKVDGRVTGVTSSQGTVFLLVGDQRIGLNDVEMIKEGVAVANASTPNASMPNAAPSTGISTGEKKEESENSKNESSKDQVTSSNADRLGMMMPITFR